MGASKREAANSAGVANEPSTPEVATGPAPATPLEAALDDGPGGFREAVLRADSEFKLIHRHSGVCSWGWTMVEASVAPSADSLWDRLCAIPDRRGRKGRQYGLAAVMVLALAAMLAGANDLRAIFRWGRRLPPEALFLLGLERAPCHAMYHYFFKALDVEAAEAVLGAWVRGSDALGHVALDGKRLRGSAPAGHDGSAGVHLVAAFASHLGGVIGQLQVEPDGNEITAALALLKGLPLRGAVITGDAAFCQRAICQAIRDGKGDYLFAVKANQATLMADLAVAFGDAFPPGTDQGPGRGDAVGA